jgi:uncharacterized damage-inducible protein DinB
MPNPAPAFAAELDREAAATRRLLERVPVDKLGWKPHPKGRTLGQLAYHIARIPGFIAQIARQDGHDVANRAPEPEVPGDGSDLLPVLDAGLADALSLLNGLDDDDASETWTLRSGERTIFALPRIGMLRTMLLNHWIHHRGQLSVYLRFLDVPVPVIYGRSADENPFDA